MRLTKLARDAGELAAIYKNTPEVHESSQFFRKTTTNSNGKPDVGKEPEVQERARFLREALGLERQFEVLEGSKGFRRKAEHSGRQPDLQEDRTRSKGIAEVSRRQSNI
jgi:hypothetical protein